MRTACFRTSFRGFTLIELLIVVAIIAILAAIAVPNFLEAQTRSKVSRARTDLRSVATALEAYRVDTNNYPPTPYVATSFDGGVLRVLPNWLSTPVAYLSSAGLQDTFISQLAPFEGIRRDGVVAVYTGDASVGPWDPGFDPMAGRRYYYQANLDKRRSAGTQQTLLQFAVPVEGAWVMSSLGPDKKRNYVAITADLDVLEPYDPTNGTMSAGDIVRSQREAQGSIRP